MKVEVPPAVAEKEPVLDVAAIDMTEQARSDETAPPADVGSVDVAKPTNRRPTAKPKARRVKPAATKAASPKRTRDGSVGRDTFEAVEGLVKDGVKKTESLQGRG